MKIGVLLLVIFGSTSTVASTFVGNGGSIGDIEMAVAKRQVTESFQEVDRQVKALDKDLETPSEICSCREEMSIHPVCEHLSRLNEEQKTFCGKFLSEKALDLAQLFQVEGKIGIRWTNSMITVKDGSSTRDSQAVTDPEKSLMTFRQDSFLGMSPSDRVFLLAHEALHFTKWEDHFLNDSGEIGPFLGEDGKRHFINAMSAAIVMMAYEKKLFEKYQIVLKRPRPWKNHWLEVEGGTVTWSETDNNTYSNDTLGTFAVAYRYQLNSQWGLRVASRQESEERTLKTQISLKEQTSTIGLGVTYRYFFRPDPFTYWGNSHFVGSAMIEKIQGTYDIVDNFTGTKEESSSYGMSLGGRFYMPALLKAYWYIGFSMGYHSLNYKGINLKYDSLRNSAMVGVSYGF